MSEYTTFELVDLLLYRIKESQDTVNFHRSCLINLLRKKGYRYQTIYDEQGEDTNTGWVIHPEYYEQWLKQPNAEYPPEAVFLHP